MHTDKSHKKSKAIILNEAETQRIYCHLKRVKARFNKSVHLKFRRFSFPYSQDTVLNTPTFPG